MARPVERLDLMRRGEAFFLGQVSALDDEDLAEPSTLPGWSRAHVVAHVAPSQWMSAQGVACRAGASSRCLADPLRWCEHRRAQKDPCP